jgi:GNAT superfamily N-acetyltransferase
VNWWQRPKFVDRTLSFNLLTDPAEHDLEELREKLLDYNTSQVGPADYSNFLATLRDGRGKLVGGVSGKIYYGWLYIEWFWVDERLRGQGHGMHLLCAAEDEARRRGCRGAWLDTFSFQARGFYEKNGYTLFGELPDYPPGQQRYFLRKPLERGTPAEPR